MGKIDNREEDSFSIRACARQSQDKEKLGRAILCRRPCQPCEEGLQRIGTSAKR